MASLGGVVQRPQSRDLIALQQNGVSKRVIEAMQAAQPLNHSPSLAPRRLPRR